MMHVHTKRPACYLEDGEPADRSPAFRDAARWCFTRIEEAGRLTPGCTGCRRFKEEIELGSNAA